MGGLTYELKPHLICLKSMRNSVCEIYTNLNVGGGSWVTTNAFKCEITLTEKKISSFNSIKECLIKLQEKRSKDEIYTCFPDIFVLNLSALDS